MKTVGIAARKVNIMRKYIIYSVLCVLLTFTSRAYELSGVIVDEDAIGLPNQQIILMSCEATEIRALDDSILTLPTNSFILSATSGSDGYYIFTNLCNGCYILSVASSPPLQYEYYTTNVSINDDDISNVILKPAQYMQYSLYGRIDTASGSPIGGAVQVFPSTSDGNISVERLKTIRTIHFTEGKIVIPEMPDGNYDLWLSDLTGVKDYGSIIPVKLAISKLGEVSLDEGSIARLAGMGVLLTLSTSPDGSNCPPPPIGSM